MLEPRSGKIALLYSDPVIRYSQYGFEQAIFRSRKNCDYKTPSKRDLLSRINQGEREDGREINSMHITEESPNGRMLEGWIVVAAVEGHMRCVWKPRREHLDWLL
jgi:hypothetical protein